MSARSDFFVVVQELTPMAFSWKLIKRQTGRLDEPVAESSANFAGYEQALDAGFDALESFCN